MCMCDGGGGGGFRVQEVSDQIPSGSMPRRYGGEVREERRVEGLEALNIIY